MVVWYYVQTCIVITPLVWINTKILKLQGHTRTPNSHSHRCDAQNQSHVLSERRFKRLRCSRQWINDKHPCSNFLFLFQTTIMHNYQFLISIDSFEVSRSWYILKKHYIQSKGNHILISNKSNWMQPTVPFSTGKKQVPWLAAVEKRLIKNMGTKSFLKLM